MLFNWQTHNTILITPFKWLRYHRCSYLYECMFIECFCFFAQILFCYLFSYLYAFLFNHFISIISFRLARICSWYSLCFFFYWFCCFRYMYWSLLFSKTEFSSTLSETCSMHICQNVTNVANSIYLLKDWCIYWRTKSNF